jgi:hypothetical protein
MIGEQRGLRTASHGGSWAGYRAELLRFPAQHTSIAVLCNVSTGNPSVRARRVAEIVLELQTKAAVAAAPLLLNWRAPDEFGGSGLVFNFRRADGRINGFADRVRNIVFEKRGS